jgi:hypothetical protein
MRLLFSFRWRSSGSTMGRRGVGRRRRERLAPLREEEDDRLGREGGLGRPRGRGLVRKGKKWPDEKKRKRAVAGPKGQMGRK